MCGQVSVPLNPSLISAVWPAEWIACPNAPQRDAGVFYFRKELNITSLPAHYWVHVSADNQFLLRVNGKFAAIGPARGDLFHWRFETIDLAPLLHPGNNLLAAIVWNFGTKAPIAQMSSRTGFLLQGDTAAEQAANTGPSWKVKQEPGWGSVQDEKFAGYFGAGFGERVDGRQLDWNWDLPDSQDSSEWRKPEIIGHAATRGAMSLDTNWESVPDPLPTMEHRLVAAGKPVRVEGLPTSPAFPAQPLTIPANTHVTLLLDNRVLQTAYPVLTVSGGRDANIRMTYAEALYDAQGQKGNRNEIAGRHIQGLYDEFISGGGSQRAFAPLNWRTWRYLQVDVTTKSTPLQLESLTAWFTAYPFQMNAKISGDIPDLDAIWTTGWRTARLCAHTTYMDTPYWERLQYVGDTRIEALISYVDSGDSRLARQAITSIDDSRVPNGLTQSRYPSSLPQFIPTFSLIWVDMIHDYWMYVDDPDLVRAILPHTRGVLDWYTAHLRPDGLMGKVGWWEFGDWTSGYKGGEPPQDADGGSTFLTLQYMEALRDASDMEAKFGNPQRATEYKALFAKAAAALNHSNWDARYGVFADTPREKQLQPGSQHFGGLAGCCTQAPAGCGPAAHLRLAGRHHNDRGWKASPAHLSHDVLLPLLPRSRTGTRRARRPLSGGTDSVEKYVADGAKYVGGDSRTDSLRQPCVERQPELRPADHCGWHPAGCSWICACRHRTASRTADTPGSNHAACGWKYSRRLPQGWKLLAGVHRSAKKL